MGISVITGGVGGMGLELAKFEVKDRHVVLVDVSEQRLKDVQAEFKKDGYDVDIVVCDVSDREAVKALAEKTASMGKIDAVFHTAGINRGSAEKVVAVDAMGTYYMIEEFFKVMEPGSNMVTVSSLASHFFKKTATQEIIQMLDHPEDPDFETNLVMTAKAMAAASGSGEDVNAYTISKLFAWRYTRRNAKRFWTKEIRINTVSPGIIATPMALGDKEGSAYAAGLMVIQRFGTPKEMASAMHYLGSEDAGDITGIDLPVDGGFTCLQDFDQIEA